MTQCERNQRRNLHKMPTDESHYGLRDRCNGEGKKLKKRVECQMSKVNSGMSAAELLLPLSCTLTDRLKAVKWNSNTDCVLSKLSHSIWEKTLNCDFFCPFFHLSIRLSFYPSIDLSVSSLMH